MTRAARKIRVPTAVTDTPVFRICLIVAGLWIAGLILYSLVTGWFGDLVHQAAYDRIEADCLSSAQPIMCQAIGRASKSDGQFFWYGRPVWAAFKYVLAPPILLLVIAAYGGSYLARLRSLSDPVARWILTGSFKSTRGD